MDADKNHGQLQDERIDANIAKTTENGQSIDRLFRDIDQLRKIVLEDKDGQVHRHDEE